MEKPSLPNLKLPVGTVYCIGRNYARHAKELGNAVPDEPVVFIKPIGTICFNNSIIQLPALSSDVHHEGEIVVAIGKPGKHISVENAHEHIAGYAAGIDFTARDLQEKAKLKAHPWAVAKGFDQFAPVSNFIPVSDMPSGNPLHITLKNNGEIKQQGNTSQMLFSVNEIISYLSSIFTLRAGDLIFTGTPAGVASVKSGDKLEVILGDNLTTLTVTIA